MKQSELDNYARERFKVAKYDTMWAKRDLKWTINHPDRFADQAIAEAKSTLHHCKMKTVFFKKLVPLRPVDERYFSGVAAYKCPNCGRYIGVNEAPVFIKYCSACGQRLMWTEE